jgi:hypothetical protein
MARSWLYLPPPALWDWYPAALTKEVKKVRKAVEDVYQLRSAADALAPPELDLNIEVHLDRSPILKAQIAALEAEISVRESCIVISLASEKAALPLINEAKAAILTVETEVRAQLGVPDGTYTPIIALQNCPAWWQARNALANIPAPDESHARVKQEADIRQCYATIRILQAALSNEPRRLAQLEAGRLHNEAHLEKLRLADEVREAPRNSIAGRVASLLGR